MAVTRTAILMTELLASFPVTDVSDDCCRTARHCKSTCIAQIYARKAILMSGLWTLVIVAHGSCLDFWTTVLNILCIHCHQQQQQ